MKKEEENLLLLLLFMFVVVVALFFTLPQDPSEAQQVGKKCSRSNDLDPGLKIFC
jgi:hypothetical protein